MRKKSKSKKVKKAIGLEKLPHTITKFYKEYKKKKEIKDLRRIKFEEREESKRIIQEIKS